MSSRPAQSAMTLELPSEKREKIFKGITYCLSHRTCKIRELARFLGILTSACPAVKYGWLYTKCFEYEKFLALKRSWDNYNAKMRLTDGVAADMLWWRLNIKATNNDLKNDNFVSGWGAYCEGESTHGWWTESNVDSHINFLDLHAIFFGLKCFANHLSRGNVLIRTDNTTALAYINKMGSVQYPKLNQLARQIWQWCESKNIWVYASYISSTENWEADQTSRVLPPETEWSLNDRDFFKIIGALVLPEIDLFASLGNHKCARYISWFRDPGAESVDAFTVSWANLFFYAFPPFSLILRALQKIRNERAMGILVVPLWPSSLGTHFY